MEHAATIGGIAITPQLLGSKEFRETYKLKYAYYAGSMVRAISSEKMVVCMGKAGMLGFLGSGSLSLDKLERAIRSISEQLGQAGVFGVNLLHNHNSPETEEKTVDVLLRCQVRCVEASAFMSISPALVRYHAAGMRKGQDGRVMTANKIIAKVSRPEVAELFLSPAPEEMIEKLLSQGKISQEEAEMSRRLPVADDICVEADSGGHTDGGVALAIFPALVKLRDDMAARFGYGSKINVGLAGGIGTPEAAAAAFIMGADFIVTGSINQCTVEAGTSDSVKDLLQQANVQDTEYAPAGDMFELGARVQVLRRGVFFPARANKLFELYRRHESIEELDQKTRQQIEDKYFKKSFAEVYEDCRKYFSAIAPAEIEKAEKNPKHKMALIFRWYFGYSNNLALTGSEDHKVDYQINCGPALGAFNQWVKGTDLEDWRNRRVDSIALKIMNETALILEKRLKSMAG